MSLITSAYCQSWIVRKDGARPDPNGVGLNPQIMCKIQLGAISEAARHAAMIRQPAVQTDRGFYYHARSMLVDPDRKSPIDVVGWEIRQKFTEYSCFL